MCKNVEETVEWIFSNLEISIFLNLRKIHSTEFFIILPVSSSVCNKEKKVGQVGCYATGQCNLNL